MTTNATNWDAMIALAAARGTTVPHMIISLDMGDAELVSLVRTTFGVDFISDSTIDDMIEEWDNR